MKIFKFFFEKCFQNLHTYSPKFTTEKARVFSKMTFFIVEKITIEKMIKSDAIAFSWFFHFWKKKNSAVLRYVSTSKMTWNVLFFIFLVFFFTIKIHNKIRCYSFLALLKMINFLRNFYGIFYGIFFQNSNFFFSKSFKISFFYIFFYNIFIFLILLLK